MTENSVTENKAATVPALENLPEGVSIEIVTQVTDELIKAWEVLLPQLSKSTPTLHRSDLEQIVADCAVTLFMARVDGEYMGSLSLAIFRIPDGLRAWIESVVVDERARGRGIGNALNRAAIAYATEREVKSIDLTSRPSREAANRLYRRLGFEQRESNVYRYKGSSVSDTT